MVSLIVFSVCCCERISKDEGTNENDKHSCKKLGNKMYPLEHSCIKLETYCAYLHASGVSVRIWRICAYLAYLHVPDVFARIWCICAYLAHLRISAHISACPRISVRIQCIRAYLAYLRVSWRFSAKKGSQNGAKISWNQCKNIFKTQSRKKQKNDRPDSCGIIDFAPKMNQKCIKKSSKN